MSNTTTKVKIITKMKIKRTTDGGQKLTFVGVAPVPEKNITVFNVLEGEHELREVDLDACLLFANWPHSQYAKAA